MGKPWNNWFHCSGSTYGAWLRGDPRGWRARHHREHVDGDYRNPPPKGKYDRLHAASKRLMKRGKVIIPPELRADICRAFCEALLFHKVEVVEAAIGGEHFHLLARFTPAGEDVPWTELKGTARKLVGIAKKTSSRYMTDAGRMEVGGVWAVRGLEKPIADRDHQLRVVK